MATWLKTFMIQVKLWTVLIFLRPSNSKCVFKTFWEFILEFLFLGESHGYGSSQDKDANIITWGVFQIYREFIRIKTERCHRESTFKGKWSSRAWQMRDDVSGWALPTPVSCGGNPRGQLLYRSITTGTTWHDQWWKLLISWASTKTPQSSTSTKNLTK